MEACAEGRRLHAALRRQVEVARRARARNLDTVDVGCRTLIAKAGEEVQVKGMCPVLLLCWELLRRCCLLVRVRSVRSLWRPACDSDVPNVFRYQWAADVLSRVKVATPAPGRDHSN